jgi:hypothetical protein
VAVCSQTLARPSAPDSVRWRMLASGELPALGNRRSRTAIIHRTVRWCTGLSGGAPDYPVSHQRRTRRSREKERADVAKIHRTVPWCTGLSGEPTITSANGRPRDQRATHGLLQRSAGCTGLSGVPTGPKEQRSDAPDLEGDRAPDMNSGCSVVHRTVRCTTRQKASLAFQVGLQRLLAALGL